MERSWDLDLEDLYLNLSFPTHWLHDLALVTVCLGLSFSVYKMNGPDIITSKMTPSSNMLKWLRTFRWPKNEG